MGMRADPAARAAKEAERTAAAAAWQAADDDRRGTALAGKEKAAFAASPVGKARIAFDRGDRVFQYSLDVMSQRAIIVAMVGSSTSRSTQDPSEILNAVCAEGWDLVNGSFVFIEQGQQSRDKFLSSGQNVATRGAVHGYYLFRRDESAKVSPT